MFVKATVHLGHVVLLIAVTERDEAQRLRVGRAVNHGQNFCMLAQVQLSSTYGSAPKMSRTISGVLFSLPEPMILPSHCNRRDQLKN